MAAPRATQFIALRNLARGSHHVRTLHMTGPATYASPVLNKERPVLNLPRDIAGLRAECKRRKIDFSGNKQDLISRLNADELAHSRAFSSVASQAKRPVPETSGSSKPVRHFNTSRSLKAVGDSSTIDFAFLPDMEYGVNPDNVQLRVPILPNNFSPPKTGAHAPEPEIVVMKPEISSMSADAVVLPMAEMHDGHADGIDFHRLADMAASKVATNFRNFKAPVEQQAGLVKQIFSDMVDDMLGATAKVKAA
ncbi:Hypothetical protein R9X50_00106400 [Acrodontium crateriforme]|uniref:SAP domain-containing protein n=1 Tax=Acrodontium crateriforme TaxID=150365 RepID=A0AAQ3M4E4_9PEZI|nr:Hypothetical protein R9X50_00106400 [Acrodontium crateriforme]